MSAGDNDNGRVAGSFTFQAQMPNGKSLSFSGYILAGQTEAEANITLDMAAKVVERQRLIAEIPELEKKLEQVELGKTQVETIIEDLTSREGKLSSQDKQHLNTMRINLKNLIKQSEAGHEAIQAAKSQYQKAA